MTDTQLVLPARFDEVQRRVADIESFDQDESTILMRAAPYETEVQLDRDLWETFATQCFERAAHSPSRVKLHHEHSGPLIGHAVEVVDKPDGIWIRAKLSDTLAGQEARELARDGTLTDCSVTFRPMREWIKATRAPDGVHIRHVRAHLLGVALVAHGAYAEHAFIASVRDVNAAREREARIAALQAFDH